MIPEQVSKLLKSKEFVYLATSDLAAQPTVAPKFLVKVEGNLIYLIDYVAGRTWENIKVNPKVAVSFMNNDNLTGYLLRGSTAFVTSGPEFDQIVATLQEKQFEFTVERVVKGVQRGKKHTDFEFAFPENGVIFKIKVEEVIEILHSGKVQRNKI